MNICNQIFLSIAYFYLINKYWSPCKKQSLSSHSSEPRYCLFVFFIFYFFIIPSYQSMSWYQTQTLHHGISLRISNRLFRLLLLRDFHFLLCSGFIVSVFTKDPQTFELASTGFRIFAINFLFSGINIVSSGIFTALSNGKISAILSFLRTLFFLVICLVTFPYFLGITGV